MLLKVGFPNLRVESSGKFPMDLGIPPPRLKNMPESNPLESRFLVRRLTVDPGIADHAHALMGCSNTKDGLLHRSGGIMLMFSFFIIIIMIILCYIIVY